MGTVDVHGSQADAELACDLMIALGLADSRVQQRTPFLSGISIHRPVASRSQRDAIGAGRTSGGALWV